MTTHLAVAFALFAMVAAITPGPSNLILASTGAAVGVFRGLPTLAGQVLGVGSMLFVIAIGLGSLVLTNDLILQVLKWCGIGFLLWLSWKIATSAPGHQEAKAVHVGFWGAAAFQWVNPKAWLICAGAVGTYFAQESGNALGRSLSMSALFILVALPSCFVWLAAGASMQRFLHGERSARIFNLTLATVLAGSILLFVR